MWSWHSLNVFQRAVWASYFDDVDTIIFLSPISCFDEKLREDSRVNRLEDSYQLWRSVCASPMLAKTQIILFLNKCDLLHKKLKRGVRVRDSIPSFGDRKNDTPTVMKCASILPVMQRALIMRPHHGVLCAFRFPVTFQRNLQAGLTRTSAILCSFHIGNRESIRPIMTSLSCALSLALEFHSLLWI